MELIEAACACDRVGDARRSPLAVAPIALARLEAGLASHPATSVPRGRRSEEIPAESAD